MKKQEKATTNSKVAKEALAAARTAQTKNGKKSSYYPINVDLTIRGSVDETPMPYLIQKVLKMHNANQVKCMDAVECLATILKPYLPIDGDDLKLLAYLFMTYELYPPFQKNGYVCRSYYAIRADTGIENVGLSINNLKENGLIVVDSGFGKDRANHYIFPLGVLYLLRFYAARMYESNIGEVKKAPERAKIERFLEYQIAVKNNQDIFGTNND